MAKYVMSGGSVLVILFEGSLRTFAPGELIEVDVPPHSWFKLINPPKPVPKMRGFKTEPVTRLPKKIKE